MFGNNKFKSNHNVYTMFASVLCSLKLLLMYPEQRMNIDENGDIM